jgi:hypothetical protein
MSFKQDKPNGIAQTATTTTSNKKSKSFNGNSASSNKPPADPTRPKPPDTTSKRNSNISLVEKLWLIKLSLKLFNTRATKAV